MNIKGDKIVVHKSAEEVYKQAENPSEFKSFMPENTEKFEVTEDGFVFALKGMPEIALKFKEKEPFSKIILTSAKETLNFDLSLRIENINEQSCHVQFSFDGKFNMFISAMVEKPLKNLIKSLTEGISEN
ncbi:SRPBCC family protein [Apibacter muscae]|uniref:SRPBCC family protein n=1 Tax=Apibacter muscae TaxID=2509004 RepID=A0A563DAU8_9FLAO|nr:SRPBCC family protein [Apibacter muscae]TWP23266.1 SRPBCC family protein [Apibacter muscae]TWP27345.1 SRPBCC family protein [Apibacter muscae]TWP28565.1 SRPBCC family protein [Apibacter muscae]